MPPKKGVSQEEKRTRLLEFFNNTHSFYTLKEIEKDGSKYTKISSMFIKDVLTELTNEGLVNVEKCGTTNLYWSFKFDKYKRLAKIHANLTKALAAKEQEKISLAESIAQEKMVRKKKDEFGSRHTLLTKLHELQQKKDSLLSELEIYRENDPDLMNQLKDKNSKLMICIEYYTDNIELLIYYFTKLAVVPIDEVALRQELRIPEEFDAIPTDPSLSKKKD